MAFGRRRLHYRSPPRNGLSMYLWKKAIRRLAACSVDVPRMDKATLDTEAAFHIWTARIGGRRQYVPAWLVAKHWVACQRRARVQAIPPPEPIEDLTGADVMRVIAGGKL